MIAIGGLNLLRHVYFVGAQHYSLQLDDMTTGPSYEPYRIKKLHKYPCMDYRHIFDDHMCVRVLLPGNPSLAMLQ